MDVSKNNGCFPPNGFIFNRVFHLMGSPWKINMEHNHRGLEDDFPFQLGDF